MIRQKIADSLRQAVARAEEEGSFASGALPEITIERPQNVAHGDFASNLPLRLARTMGMTPLEVAEKIVEKMSLPPEIDRAAIAPPGFINFTLKNEWLTSQVEAILAAAKSYGDISLGKGKNIQIEFVSVNPTGPLHVGHGRGAVLGSTLANVLSAAGYSVQREYYLNDIGNQIGLFRHSLYVRYQQHFGKEAAMPPDGYYGNYMVDLAKEIAEEEGDRFVNLAPQEAVARLSEIGLERIINSIKEDLRLLNVTFDQWFSEKSLYAGGQYDKAMAILKSGNYVAKKEDAVWFESSLLGEDKDNVLIRSDGSPTYFASDIAYHYNKFLERKFDTVIDIWGADHQGHVPRMKAVIKALGQDPEQLKVIICQMVTLRRGKEIIRVSKRSGDLITLREVIDEVGADACRFSFLSYSAESQMDFDLELAKKQSADNPVYYVQYAHARIASILRLAGERKIDYRRGDVSLLTTEPELTLIRHLIMLSEIIERAAVNLEPHHLPYYAQALATVFHSFYKQCRVVSEDEALTGARLKLVRATQIVLVKVLSLMGMTAPERM
jgi:arginyl-tRNA synthetase